MSFLLPAHVNPNEFQTDGLFKDHIICTITNIQITAELLQGKRYNCRHVKTLRFGQRLGKSNQHFLKS